jgi:hypothetical protein
VYDGVDKSLLYRAVRETRQITENLMRELCPGWDWEKRTRHHSARDGKNVIRKPEEKPFFSLPHTSNGVSRQKTSFFLETM